VENVYIERLRTMPRHCNVLISVIFNIILEYSSSESWFFCRMYDF